jgi:cell division protein ZapA
MDPDQLININVIIADRPYRLKIKPDEEEQIRKAAKLVHEKVKEFQNTYEAKDKQDYLAMASIIFAVESLNSKGYQIDEDHEIVKKINELDTVLTHFVQSH